MDEELEQQKLFIEKRGNKKKGGKFPGELTMDTPIYTQEA